MEIIQQEQEKAILVICKFMHSAGEWEIEESEEELKQLTVSSGTQVISCVHYKSDKPNPSLLIGTGKTEEILETVYTLDANVVIFDHDLSPAQQRNLEDIIDVKTIDRTQLILDIFAQHAYTQEGKLQVELAQLNYLLPRLTGKGIYLSRLGGGIGTKGPGEQKLEVDRRRIRKRITHIKNDLKKVNKRKDILIRKRKESAVPLIGLIGYTNAGKTTLLNNLTNSKKLVKNSLFSTLDTVSRKFELFNGQQAILFDTVGFIHNLPHHLIESFKSTLDEVLQADILLHIIDISNPMAEKRADSVYSVLKELDAEEKEIVTVLNKIDLVENNYILEKQINKYPNPVFVSAKTKQGFQELQNMLIPLIRNFFIEINVKIPQTRMDLVNLLYDKGHVINKEYLDSNIHITAMVPKKVKGIIEKYAKIRID